VGDDVKPHLHLVEDLQCSEQCGKRRQAEIGLLQGELAGQDDHIPLLLEMHGHDDRAGAITHRDLDMGEPLGA
jgi:hypothetical protein